MSHHLLPLISARLSRWLPAGWALLLASCTLTGGDYEPIDVDALPARAQGCSNGSQCCESTPCGAGLACREGRCEPASSGASPDAGACSGVACSPAEPQLPDPQLPDPQLPESQSPEGLTPPEALPPEAMEPAGMPASCDDEQQNGDETALDCGGSCPSCPSGRACSEPDDCQSAVCSAEGCAAGIARCCQEPSCTDGVANASESDVDCGGRCQNCPTGRACNGPGDCQSAVCGGAACPGGAELCCQAPSCSDGVQNGDEPLVDCGSAACGLCALGTTCSEDAQCTSGFCATGRCTDPGTCTDGVRNGRETATDCGGGTCRRCADRLPCTVANDCVNNNCFNSVCISCGSGIIDGTETDVDCGGADPFCRRCDPGRRCLINSDCVTGFCNNGFC